jgi:23S rRNA (guanosine2251-2'-O)-methyltransferase
MKKDETILIYGKHPVLEALTNSQAVITRLLVLDNCPEEIKVLAEKRGLKPEILNINTWPKDLAGAVHQGVAVQVVADSLYVNYKDWLNDLNLAIKPAVAILAEIQDPHNVGAIIRSAAGFGISAIFLPEHNQVDLTATVIKASAGMVFKLPIIKIGNVNQTLADLKEQGFWIYGLDGTGKNDLTKEEFTTPVAFVLGNEGNGLRQKTAEACDILLKIPLDPKCESLNVSTAAAVTFFNWGSRKK